MKHIKLFEQFLNESKKDYKNHKLADHIITKKDAGKLANFEDEQTGPVGPGFSKSKYDNFINDIEGKTIREFSEWRWPEEPQKQFNITLHILDLDERSVKENSSTNLTPNQLEKHGLYEVLVHGDNNEEKFKFQELVLDINDKEILALDYDYFRLEKDKSKLKDVYKIDLKYVTTVGIEDTLLDECVILYNIKGDEIKTELGFKVEFVVKID